MGVDYDNLPDDLKEKIVGWQKNSPANKQIEVMKDIAAISQEMLGVVDDLKENGETNAKQFGALLADIREKLVAVGSQEAPEMPDYAKPVVESVKKLEKALTDAIKAVDVKPEVKVSVPEVEVPGVDLSGLEKIIKSDIPKAFEKAMKAIPQTPAVELTPLEAVIREGYEEMVKLLESIDTASRMKPQFPVSQLNSMKTTLESIDAKTASSSTVYLTKIDNTTTANVIYIGKALPGSTGAQNVWQIKKLDTSTLALDKTWADGNDSFDNIWNNRASLSYS